MTATSSQPGPAERLLLEKDWTQGAYARDRNGRSTCIELLDAVCFCMVASMEVAYQNIEDFRDAIKKVRNSLNVGSISLWNDDPARTKEEVCAALRKAGNL